MAEKTCNTCGVLYTGDLCKDFRKIHNRWFENQCKHCISEKKRASYSETDRIKCSTSLVGRSCELVGSARARAARKKIPITISAAYVRTLFESQSGCCLLTGLPFDFSGKGCWTRNPMSPSLDRERPELGYIEGNVRLVLACVNQAVNQWGDSVFANWSSSYINHSASPEPNRGIVFDFNQTKIKRKIWQLNYSSILSSRQRGLPHDIDTDFIKHKMLSQKNTCDLTGICFDFFSDGNHFMNPNAPSLDRIQPIRGYAKNNIRVVLTCVNFAFGEWGKEVFDSWLPHYLVKNRILTQ